MSQQIQKYFCFHDKCFDFLGIFIFGTFLEYPLRCEVVNILLAEINYDNINMQWSDKLIRAFYVKKSWHMKKVGCFLYFFKLRFFNKKLLSLFSSGWFCF